jgi:hypothetical protein
MGGKFMELKDFIGKIVISTSTNKRYRLHRITSPYIDVESELPNSGGYPSHYRFDCINGDPFSSGTLVFEDQSLTEPFKAAYQAYCNTEDARWENYGYYMRKY